uniref:Uncharacterized protein n=1 Tax=Cereibacter sphaeroides (strain ATCC 17025 / ATH 2.4.3) TaxID=349102 RepID=A4WX16_CERS5
MLTHPPDRSLTRSLSEPMLAAIVRVRRMQLGTAVDGPHRLASPGTPGFGGERIAGQVHLPPEVPEDDILRGAGTPGEQQDRDGSGELTQAVVCAEGKVVSESPRH